MVQANKTWQQIGAFIYIGLGNLLGNLLGYNDRLYFTDILTWGACYINVTL